MAAVAEGMATGTTATTQQHRGGLLQPQLIGHPPAAEVGAIAEPAVLAAAAAAELVHAGWQIERLRAWGGSWGFWLLHHLSHFNMRDLQGGSGARSI